MSVRSCDCRNVVGISQVVRFSSIVEFSTGVKVYDTLFAIEGSRRALKMRIKSSR